MTPELGGARAELPGRPEPQRSARIWSNAKLSVLVFTLVWAFELGWARISVAPLTGLLTNLAAPLEELIQDGGLLLLEVLRLERASAISSGRQSLVLLLLAPWALLPARALLLAWSTSPHLDPSQPSQRPRGKDLWERSLWLLPRLFLQRLLLALHLAFLGLSLLLVYSVVRHSLWDESGGLVPLVALPFCGLLVLTSQWFFLVSDLLALRLGVGRALWPSLIPCWADAGRLQLLLLRGLKSSLGLGLGALSLFVWELGPPLPLGLILSQLGAWSAIALDFYWYRWLLRAEFQDPVHRVERAR